MEGPPCRLGSLNNVTPVAQKKCKNPLKACQINLSSEQFPSIKTVLTQ